MIEAVLWDNDGVLVDTETLFFETTRAAFVRLGVELKQELWGKLYLGEGKSTREIAVLLGAENSKISEVLEERNQAYLQKLRQAPPLRPHVRETLSALSGKVRMAMVTGCHRNQLQLMHAGTGFLGFFEVIVTGDDCANPKPDPELYLAGLKALGLAAERCLAVEDSGRGLAAARAAGIPCIVVPTELTVQLGFPGACRVAPGVSAVAEYIRERRACPCETS